MIRDGYDKMVEKKKDKVFDDIDKSRLKTAPERAIVNGELDPTDPEDLLKIEEEAKAVYDLYIKPEKIEKSKKDLAEFEAIIDDEKSLLADFKEYDEPLKVVWGNKLYSFKVKPIQAGDDFKNLNMDGDLIADVPLETREAMVKRAMGNKLTREEERILQEFDQTAPSEMAESTLIMAHHILANYVTPPDFGGDIEKRLAWWETKPFAFKMFLVDKAAKKLGLDADTSFRLFQDR